MTSMDRNLTALVFTISAAHSISSSATRISYIKSTQVTACPHRDMSTVRMQLSHPNNNNNNSNNNNNLLFKTMVYMD